MVLNWKTAIRYGSLSRNPMQLFGAGLRLIGVTTRKGGAEEHRALFKERTMDARTSLTRGAAALAAVAALAVTACAPDQAAEFEEDSGSAAQATDTADEASDLEAELPHAEAGLVHEDISQEATVQETLRPGDMGHIMTPTGTLSVESVERVEAVPAQEIGVEGAEEVLPADGEEFRILTMRFSPDEVFAESTDASLALNSSAGQSHLQDLSSEQEFRILFSVPPDGSTTLTVSSEGHDQFLDVLTGEREEDEVTAGYYRQVTVQDVNHSFQIDRYEGELVDERGWEGSRAMSVDYGIWASSVNLAGWSEEHGWADPGEAWVVIDWNYEFEANSDVTTGVLGLNDIDIEVLLAVGGEHLEESHWDDGDYIPQGETATSFAVPIETTEVELSFAGAVGSLEMGHCCTFDDAPLTFASSELEVAFPDERYGSDATDIEDVEEETSDAEEDDDQ